MSPREYHAARILTKIETGTASQRSIARDLGIALGLTNILVKEMARKGLVKVTRPRGYGRRYQYLITPAGHQEKERLDRERFESHLGLYVELRERIRRELGTLSAQLHETVKACDKRIAFWGANELAEIAYVCLDHTDLVLVGVVDQVRRTPFFGHPVYGYDELKGRLLGGSRFEKIVAMMPRSAAADECLLRAGIAHEDVLWL